MTYASDNLIEAADFNNLRNLANQIYGVGFGDSGYGQTAIVLPTVAGGTVELIKSAEWTALRSALSAMASHQGTVVSLPPASEMDVGALIQAHTVTDNTGDIPGAITALTNNRLAMNPAVSTVFFSQLTSTRATSWTTFIRHEFSITFTTVDEARYFFNSGGEIIMRASRTGGAVNPQNTAWTNLLGSIGNIVFNAGTTFATGGIGTTQNVGYYDLPLTTYGLLWEAASTDPTYAANEVRVFGRVTDGPSGVNGDNGRILNLRVDFADDHVGGTDTVSGTFTSNVDMRVDTTVFTIATPAFANITLLTAGT